MLEIVHNHDNGYLDWLFHQNVFPLRESVSGWTFNFFLLLNCIIVYFIYL